MKTKTKVILIAIVVFGLSFWFIYSFPNIYQGEDTIKNENPKNGTYYDVSVTTKDGKERFHYQGKCQVDFSPDSVYFVLRGDGGAHEVVLLEETDRVNLIKENEGE